MKMKSLLYSLTLCLAAGSISVSAEDFEKEMPQMHMENEERPERNSDRHMGDGHKGGEHMGGGMSSLTEEQETVIEATADKFQQFTYEDSSNEISLEYNLFIPEEYNPEISYPLIMFIPDSSASGKSAEQILEQYYGAVVWASETEQEKHASFVMVPAFSETVVQDDYWTSEQINTAVHILENIQEIYNIDSNHLYTTGQSMGCMTSLYLNSIYPDLFAASMYVSGQWDITTLSPLEDQKFFYITCSGDAKASGGQEEVMNLLNQDGISYASYLELDPDASQDEQEAVIQTLIEQYRNANFVRFNGLSHMESFNYAYELESVRDWLFAQ